MHGRIENVINCRLGAIFVDGIQLARIFSVTWSATNTAAEILVHQLHQIRARSDLCLLGVDANAEVRLRITPLHASWDLFRRTWENWVLQKYRKNNNTATSFRSFYSKRENANGSAKDSIVFVALKETIPFQSQWVLLSLPQLNLLIQLQNTNGLACEGHTENIINLKIFFESYQVWLILAIFTNKYKSLLGP